MKTERKPFAAIDADIDDDKLDRLAAQKGIGVLVKPEPHAKPATGESQRSAASEPAKEPINPDDEPTPRNRWVAVTLDMPDYVRKELKIRAAHRGTSIQHVIMTSLQAADFEIRKADLIEDGRRGRGEHGTQG